MLHHVYLLRACRCSHYATASRWFSNSARRVSNGGLNCAELQPAVLHPLFPNEGHSSGTSSWQEEEEPDHGCDDLHESTNSPRSGAVETDFTPKKSIDAGYNGSFQAPMRPQFRDTATDVEFFSGDSAVYDSNRAQSLVDGLELSSNAQRSTHRTDVGSSQNAYQNIREALEIEDSSLLLERIWELSRDQSSIAAIPSTTFVEILRRLDPSDDFLPFRYGFAERVPKHYRMLTAQTLESMEDLKRRRIMYQDICSARSRNGRSLSTRENAQLLRCARGTWDGRLASKIMMDMISKRIQPDLACYNYYFEAKCWSDAWYPSERQLLRVFPYATSRRQQRSKLDLSGGLTIYPHTVGQNGLKSEVTKVFSHMIEGGILPDGKAFGHLITALAREGDMQGVKAVMKKTWDVDVDSLNTRRSERSTDMPQSSPLYPNQDLLFIIAHAFGSNNDVPTALRAVDQISRIFSIPIPTNVWAELLEWSFTLSTRRHKKRKEDGAQLGQLDIHTPEDLWNVLTSEPYNCEPTLPMFDIMVRSLKRRDCLFRSLGYIIQGLDLHNQNVVRYWDHVQRKEIENVERHKVLSMELRKQRFTSFVVVSRWFSLLLSGQRWLSRGNGSRVLFWQRQLLPDVVDIFWRYKEKKGVKYAIETGNICLQEQLENSGNTSDAAD